ncbi:hypothetical protein HBB16_14005 [Pseudonocardia sp. MCCB 268]|nr:hypothetical protein [Pseudonocardia cytotoxica]
MHLSGNARRNGGRAGRRRRERTCGCLGWTAYGRGHASILPSVPRREPAATAVMIENGPPT